MEEPVPEREQCRLFEFNQDDVSFLRKVGIRRCVIHCRRARPLLPSFHTIVPGRLTENDTQRLRECGVAWEQRPAVQLPLDFSGCLKEEHDPEAPTIQSTGGVNMKLEHETLVTSDGKKIVTGTWRTETGKVTSQKIQTTDLKTGKVTTTNVSGGRLLP